MLRQTGIIKNPLARNSLMKVQTIEGSKRKSQTPYFKEERKEKVKNNNEDKETKILSNAYKNVINVITNFFDEKGTEIKNKKKEDKNEINDKKENNENSKEKKLVNKTYINKNPLKTNISCNQPKILLSNVSSKIDESYCSGASQNNNLLFTGYISKKKNEFF